jgi:hypothetical protein
LRCCFSLFVFGLKPIIVTGDGFFYFSINMKSGYFKCSNVENVGRPLVGLLIGNDDFIHGCSGDPQGASLDFL